ncbi:MAG: hypothetical protein ACI9TK_001084 [Flavobacteriaceae bacterium]|jgi:hypothetical protein|tara:strand:+ start:5551 stop:7230 length:1680 start_codon:yes stop_codon:yes gene_type:complete
MLKNYWVILKLEFKMKKVFYVLFAFILMNSLWSQSQGKLTVAIDSIKVKIGEQLNYTLQVKADSTAQVIFPEQPIFAPFELLEESLVDTLKMQSHYLYTKKYALIQFDSGNYFLPQQQVMINGFSKIAALIPVRVEAVVVDTLQQKLYDIKPLVVVDKNYEVLIAKLLWGAVFLLILVGVLYAYLFQKRRKELRKQELLPFDRAIEELKALEGEKPSVQDEFKKYYSRLTDVVRRYLEEEAKIDALESTSEELLAKLEMRKDAGTLDLDHLTLKSLREVLRNADLVKFAKSMPEYRIANEDRIAVEHVVIETKEALPEPTEEELKQKEAYKELLAQKRRKEQWIWGLSGAGLLTVLALIISMLVYGYYPVRDTLLKHPTKVLSSGQWVTSQYGTPPLKIKTPEVLERVPLESKTLQQFSLGTLDSPFYIDVLFDFPKPDPQKAQNPKNETAAPKDADEERGQAMVTSIISNFEAKGAVNILMKNDELNLPSGVPVAKIYGTLDYPRQGENERVRCNFNALLITFEEGTIIITMMYEKEDRYASEIEERIINSIELIKEL